MENIQKNLSKSLFHTQILESELKQLDLSAQKTVLQTWVSSLDELNKKDKASRVSAFSAGILEKLLGYNASGNAITIQPDSSPDHFFDLLLGQFQPANQKAAAALKKGKLLKVQEKPYTLPAAGTENLKHRPVIIGSGPAGLACASDLAKMGYGVKIFEALHKVGGVLVYGIPEFRLPKQRIVAREIAEVERLGVEIETDVIVGRTVTVDSLLGEEGYDAVFIGSGAGLPRFMGIPGENLNGVVSANEFLTRANLMRAYDDTYDTPIYVGKRVVVVGGGNVAMDAVRTAKRLGAEATIVYRRSEKELPARVEEVHHAKQEGICFRMLTNPAEVLGDERGWVTGIRCVEMELGEPDQSGRRSPVVKPGSEFDIACDVVIMALGTSPNPLLAATIAGLETDRRGCITADGQGATSREGVFAGGAAVTGAATVILAMGAGRTAARAIDEYIRKR